MAALSQDTKELRSEMRKVLANIAEGRTTKYMPERTEAAVAVLQDIAIEESMPA